MNGSSRNRGFTLIEVMVSLALTGIALALLLGGFRFSSQAWERGERVTGDSAALLTTQRILRNTLGQALPVVLEDDSGAPRFAFIGDAERVLFSAIAPPYPTLGGLYSIELQVLEEGDRYQLWLWRAPYDSDQFRAGLFQPLASDDGMNLVMESRWRPVFEYLDQPGDDEEPVWRREWDEPERPPALVRLLFEDPDARWPAITVALPADTDRACLSPEFGGICR